MDPDPSGSFSSSAIFKTTVLTVVFTSFYVHKTQQSFILFKPPAASAAGDSIAEKVKVVTTKKKKTIYLTFDDGPNKGTKNVMRIIDKEQVPITLFVIGEHVYGSKSQSNIYDSVCMSDLFEIANHSYTHAHNNYSEFYEIPDSVVADFRRCADSLHLVSNIVRTPGRNIWRTDSLRCTDIKKSKAAADTLFERGFIALGWDLEWHFDNQQRPVQDYCEMIDQIDSVFSRNKTKTPEHLILLAHDQVYISPQDSASLHNFISELKRRDEYNFETVSRYPGVQ